MFRRLEVYFYHYLQGICLRQLRQGKKEVRSEKTTFYFLFRLFLLIALYLLKLLSFVHLIYISKGILTKFGRPMGYINRQISARKNEKQYFFPFYHVSANQNRLFRPRDQSFTNSSDSTIRQYLATNKWNSSYKKFS